MWTCSGCGQQHQADMQVCWNCGTSLDGTPDPTFREVDQRRTEPVELTLDEQIAERFICSKCNSKHGRVKRVAMTGTGVSRLLDVQHNTYLAISCHNCGKTEWFDLEMLEGKDTLGALLDLWFELPR
jgi:predicted nucleic-acid-binding Zn-ribbon protein